jgi:hypothetical protein
MNAVVLPINKTDRATNRLPGTPIIRAELDAAGLTLEGYRVYCHLACHARPTFVNGEIHWAACRSLNRMATECFRGSYPNTTEEVLRRKAAESIAELIDRNMIVRQRHQPGVTLANLYLLLPMEQWRSPTDTFKNPNVRKGRGQGRRQKTTVTDPPRITPDRPTDRGKITPNLATDLPTIALDLSKNVVSNTNFERSTTVDRSSQDQDLYIEDLDLLVSSSKEREREKGENTFSSENKQPEQEKLAIGARAAPAEISGTAPGNEELIGKPETQEQDECSAAAGASKKSNFDASSYDWTRYDKAGDGGSHPKFLEYMLRRTQNYSDRRVQRGKTRIVSLLEYALEQVHNDGESLYRDFEIDQGLREPPPKPPKPERSQRSQPAQPIRQPAAPIAQWQRISDNLNLRPSDMLLQALEQELSHLYPNESARDAVERIQWLLRTNPQWGIVLKDGKFDRAAPEPTDRTDLSDLLINVKWRFEELGFDRDARSQWLHQHYGATIQGMTSQQLERCLAQLQQLSTTGETP